MEKNLHFLLQQVAVTLDDGSKLVLKYNPEEIILFNDEDKAHSFH